MVIFESEQQHGEDGSWGEAGMEGESLGKEEDAQVWGEMKGKEGTSHE